MQVKFILSGLVYFFSKKQICGFLEGEDVVKLQGVLGLAHKDWVKLLEEQGVMIMLDN